VGVVRVQELVLEAGSGGHVPGSCTRGATAGPNAPVRLHVTGSALRAPPRGPASTAPCAGLFDVGPCTCSIGLEALVALHVEHDARLSDTASLVASRDRPLEQVVRVQFRPRAHHLEDAVFIGLLETRSRTFGSCQARPAGVPELAGWSTQLAYRDRRAAEGCYDAGKGSSSIRPARRPFEHRRGTGFPRCVRFRVNADADVFRCRCSSHIVAGARLRSPAGAPGPSNFSNLVHRALKAALSGPAKTAARSASA